MTAYTAKTLLPLIDPKISLKYSPNLHAYIRRNFKSSPRNIVVTKKDSSGFRHVGVYHDYDGWLSGARIMSVLCLGKEEQVWAIRPPHEIDQTFWDRYIEHGRCAMDPDHQTAFLGGDARWLVTEGANGPERRECLWCGQHTQVMKRWTETVEKSKWVTA